MISLCSPAGNYNSCGGIYCLRIACTCRHKRGSSYTEMKFWFQGISSRKWQEQYQFQQRYHTLNNALSLENASCRALAKDPKCCTWKLKPLISSRRAHFRETSFIELRSSVYRQS